MGLTVISCGLIWEPEQMDTCGIIAWICLDVLMYTCIYAEKYRTHTQIEEHKFNGFQDMVGMKCNAYRINC